MSGEGGDAVPAALSSSRCSPAARSVWPPIIPDRPCIQLSAMSIHFLVAHHIMTCPMTPQKSII